MNLLHRVFEREASEGAIAIMLTELLCAKIKEKGITLSSRQRRSLKDQISAGKYSNIKIDPWKFWQSQRIDLEITPEDVKAVESSFERWVERLPYLLESLSDEIAVSVLRSLKNQWPKQARYERQQQMAFRARLDRRWRTPFDLLRMLLTISTEFGAAMNARLRAAPSSSPCRRDVLTRLHARACQVSSEVLTLLGHGFADGAIARWRTLHEIAVVSIFIANGDEGLAERYTLHQTVESLRAAREYQTYCSRLGYDPMEPQGIHDLERQNSALVARFGAAFREPYGWASERLGGVASPALNALCRSITSAHSIVWQAITFMPILRGPSSSSGC
ncbi:MAG: DUF5677 domain-containing protein [Deltaproteobacteria bacterium]|nr:DUF5677 domain-containing protein [Deltaproteobacteria bacterium]